MRIDKMKAWLGRPAPGAERLQLCWEGLEGLQVLSDWTFDELRTMGECGDDVAETISGQAQEHCDAQEGSKRTRYTLRWIGSDSRVLRSTMHHVRPTPPEEDDPLGSVLADLPESVRDQGSGAGSGLFYEAMVKELARALLDKDRAMNEAYKTSLVANHKTIEMLLAQAESSFRQVSELRSQVAELEAQQPEVLSAAQEAEALKRAAAWDKLLNILPEASELLIHAATAKLLGDEDPTSDAKPNGHTGTTGASA